MATKSEFNDAFDGPTESYAPSAYETMEEGSGSGPETESHLNEGHYAAAKDMMDAHTRSDHKAYAAALKSFMDCSK